MADKLSAPMQQIIRNFSAGAVATINADGSPAVSPKATFVIIDARHIAYGDIRSPGTRANLQARPQVEVCFIDVLARLAVRVTGSASSIGRDSPQGHELMPLFEAQWGPYLEHMQGFVRIEIRRAELITSPAYDVGLERAELVAANLEKLQNLARA